MSFDPWESFTNGEKVRLEREKRDAEDKARAKQNRYDQKQKEKRQKSYEEFQKSLAGEYDKPEAKANDSAPASVIPRLRRGFEGEEASMSPETPSGTQQAQAPKPEEPKFAPLKRF